MSSRAHTTIPPTIPIRELAEHVGAELGAPSDLHVTGVAGMGAATATEITFLSNPAYRAQLSDSRAGAVLIAPDAGLSLPDTMVALHTPNPYLAFARALELFHPPKSHTPGIHSTAVVPSSCTVPPSATIGPYVVLGERVALGEGTVLHPHVVLYDDVQIGEHVVIHAHATVREACTVGHRSIIQSGVVIGADGFGFAPVGDGTWKRIPQIGRVAIGNDTDIQANACVDRGAVGTTSVGDGSRIDNLVQVGHGSTVGSNTLLCGQVGLAGSSKVGNNVMMGGQVGMSGHITIGDGAQVAAQSGVIDDLEGGKQYGGVPATDMRTAIRREMSIRKLPDLLKRFRLLERDVKALQENE